MAIAVFSEYLDNAIVAMGPTSSSSSYNQDDNIAKVETTPPDMKPSVQDFFASFASLERKGTTTVEEKFRKIVEDTDGKLKAIDKYERERALERRSVEAVRDKLRELEERSRRDPDYMVMKLEAIDRLERRRVESRLRGQQQIADGMRQMMEKVREGNLYSYCTCIGCQPSTPPTPAPQVDIEENAVQIFIKSNEESDKERNLEMVAEKTEETEEEKVELVENK